MSTLIRNVRLIDAKTDSIGSILIKDGIIAAINPPESTTADRVFALPPDTSKGGQTRYALMPAFIELHAHFRDPGWPEKETLESALLAAVAGGYGTVCCMPNTKPVIDSPDLVRQLYQRAQDIGLADLYPVLAITKGMEGKDSSHLSSVKQIAEEGILRMLSEDGKDVSSDEVFLKAMLAAAKQNLIVSCHCDFGGDVAQELKERGAPRQLWSRVEEDFGTNRVIQLAARTNCKLHIDHVSTLGAVLAVRKAKAKGQDISCEAAPHHFALTHEDATRMGDEGYGRVNPPLRDEEDRQALIEAIADGTIDAIATDHAPHTAADKTAGVPGFTGLESAFAVSKHILVDSGKISLSRLSALMAANPAAILGLSDRGLLQEGLRADLSLVNLDEELCIPASGFRSRSNNTPFFNMKVRGKIQTVWRAGHIVYDN